MLNILALMGMLFLVYRLKLMIQKACQAVIMLMGGSKTSGILFYTLLFFPGIIIHELTHFITAAMLGVPTGDINLIPNFKNENKNQITLGSVKVAKSDFIRESLIGGAPFIFGLTIIYFLVEIFFKPLMLIQIDQILKMTGWQLFLVAYIILAIGNTMFTSREDARAWPVIIILMAVVLGLLTVSGNIKQVGLWFYPFVIRITNALLLSMEIVLAVDLILFLFLLVWQLGLQRITHQRVV